MLIREVSWESVLGSILGSVLLDVFVNDLEEDLECTLIKAVDDTRLEGAVNVLESKIAMQRSLGKVEKWANRSFNKDKIKVLWLGGCNPLQWQKLSTDGLAGSVTEQDLPVLVDRHVSLQCWTLTACAVFAGAEPTVPWISTLSLQRVPYT